MYIRSPYILAENDLRGCYIDIKNDNPESQHVIIINDAFTAGAIKPTLKIFEI